jgi:ribosomal protein L13E
MGELRRDGHIKNGDLIIIERKVFMNETGKEIKYMTAKAYNDFREMPRDIVRRVKDIGDTSLAQSFKKRIGHGIEI